MRPPLICGTCPNLGQLSGGERIRTQKSFRESLLGWGLGLAGVLILAVFSASAYPECTTIFDFADRLSALLSAPSLVTWNDHTLSFVVGFTAVYIFLIVFYYTTREAVRPGAEHGSAQWGSVHALNRKYSDRNKEKNAILTMHLRMSLNTMRHFRNLLQIVVGGSGSRKTRSVILPNVMLANTSYICTDPKGEILRSVGPLLLRNGYVVRVFNLIDPEHSDRYNPFRYIRKDADVFRLIDNFIKNTTPKNASQNDPFWEKAEIALDSALMLYLLHEASEEEQTMEMMLTMIEYGGAKESGDDYRSALDLLFEALEDDDPEHIAVRQYRIFKQAAGKTAKSILVSAAVRLAAFALPEIQRITNEDTLELGQLGDRKQAIFCVIPDSNDASLNFLVGMLYTQAFQELYYKADVIHRGRLPIPVRIMFDEFANIALPDGYARLQATMRSRNIMTTIVLQNISQLKALFKDDWEGIIGNADCMIYLGGNEQSTHKYISELLGKETIQTKNSSQSRGRNGSMSVSKQQAGRELMTPDEVRQLDDRDAIVLLRGEKPVIDRKYDLLKHPSIRFTEHGGASPYIHSPNCLYLAEDIPSSSLEELEIIDESEE